MPSAGAHTIATRPSITDSNSGRCASSFHGPGSVVSVSGRRTFGPSDSSAAPAAVTASALTSALSHSRTTMPSASSASGQP